MAERAVPILPSRDLRESLAFYRALGFENRGAPPEEWDYLLLGRGGVELHLVADPSVDPLRTASSCYAYVEDVDALHALWSAGWPALTAEQRAAGARLVPPRDQAYGMREMAVVDPSGNLLRVGSPLPPGPPAETDG
ncbi:bleomycin resistance protein [Cellulomonas endophytica]|uniref:bleomycin resistance protein n=1 Tax=Cellulomonas endophytica TaxID=2494735 RepID=UPI001013338F|nr:VOC family protein [Cellulomonas endophytica]